MTYNKTFIAALAIFGLFAGTASASTLTQNLSVGSTGSEVIELQTFLASDSSIYPEGLITGTFGSLTRAAVVRYQAANGISQTGTVGPITRASINSNNGLGNGNSSFDSNAPLMGSTNVSKSNNSATLSWTTNEPAKSRVMFGTGWPFLYASASSVGTNSYNLGSSITLTGLQPNTAYYYVRESVDGSGNIMWTTHKTLVTNQ
ncbi:MAG: peptidoglycan-binding protein [Candidatus Paceibacterota bacterium]|jgi:peptidoglycan hydrolase-like protein with peptidoglycan-binding domain